jgi:rfaE bifunctional protein kinase chain/domain
MPGRSLSCCGQRSALLVLIVDGMRGISLCWSAKMAPFPLAGGISLAELDISSVLNTCGTLCASSGESLSDRQFHLLRRSPVTTHSQARQLTRNGAPGRATQTATLAPLAAPSYERHWPHRLGQIIAGYAGKRVLVLGDMIADEYIIGAATRMSREAPIPVIAQRERFIVPGGALNPAVNARALGAEVTVAGVIGDDEAGRCLRQRLSELGVSHDLLITERSRPTSTKMRVLAGSAQGGPAQHIARIDTIDTTPPDSSTVRRLMDTVATLAPRLDAIIISDYDVGLLVLPLIEATLRQARDAGCVTLADAHSALSRFHDVVAITPNQAEAEAATGIAIRDHAGLDAAGRQLLADTSAQGVLITRGSEGMSLYERDGLAIHMPAYPVEVRDTTGAGDTVAAAFALGLATGAAMADAATIANVAAGLVVRRLGCATTTPDELLHAVASIEVAW